MTQQEMGYRSVVSRIGIAMLVLFGGINLYRLVMSEILPLFLSGASAVTATVVEELVSALLYAAAFLVPVFVFYGISHGKAAEPFEATLRLPRGTVLYLMASLAIISAAAYINSYVLDIFESITIFGNDSAPTGEVTPRAGYEIVLAFITTAVVPAFVEEALFRGMVLKNLLPYGRTTAVLASALLFGIMHQSAAQFFYATVAGLVIGYIYVHTSSIWCCVLIHFCNNAFSVFMGILRERLPLNTAILADTIIYLVLLLLGLVAVFLLMRGARDRSLALLREGCFERDAAPDPEYATVALPAARRVRLFFTAPMIVFLALCAVQILYMLLLAVLY